MRFAISAAISCGVNDIADILYDVLGLLVIEHTHVQRIYTKGERENTGR
jgi:hypothetical protein